MSPVECWRPSAAKRYEAEVEPIVWSAIVGADCIVEGSFRFASFKPEDPSATVKVDGEMLYKDHNAYHLGTVLGAVANHPCVKAADVLLYVPDGMKKFAQLLGGITRKDIAYIERVPGAADRYSFQFVTEEDEALALSAEFPIICEDVVSTLGSVAGVRALLPPTARVHSIAPLLRGQPQPEYQKGLVDHYLVRRDLPLHITAA
ncbi:MAG TPA: hypothetical protein VFB59_01135 [Candidatus Saccharimonadales bacterium]|nr:hypothetical protein [Candidatus Saccharimonadales bacterium]